MKRKLIRILTAVGAICLVIFLAAFLTNRDELRPRRVGVFLYAQHPVIMEIYRGFKKDFDREASNKGIAVEYVERNADGDAAQANAVANYFRSVEADLVFVVGLPAAQALKSARVQHPVVFGGPPDPVAAGLVPNLNDHGSNFTGTKYFPPVDMILQVLRQAYPQSTRIAVIHNPGEANSMVVVSAFLAAAQSQGFTILDLGASNATEIEATLRTLSFKKPDGLFLPTDNLVYSSLDRIVAHARDLGIPVFNCTRLSVEKGALFSLATDYERVGEISAGLAARIVFAGEKPQGLDVIDVREGNLYLSDQHPAASRIRPVPGYEVVHIR